MDAAFIKTEDIDSEFVSVIKTYLFKLYSEI